MTAGGYTLVEHVAAITVNPNVLLCSSCGGGERRSGNGLSLLGCSGRGRGGLPGKGVDAKRI
jgi:hypothetical protein